MATAVGLNMKMTADTSGIGRGMNRAEKLLNGVDKNARSAARSLRVMTTIQVGGVLLKGLSSIASTLTAVTRSAVNYANSLRSGIDETAKLARRTGIAVDALQGFQVAADLSGVQNLESAVQRLTISLGDAAAGVKEPRRALEQLGLNFEELNALAPEDQFRAVAAAFEGVGSQAEKAAIAADLFGRSGVELLPLFASNLAEVEARAARLGIVLSGDQTAAIEEMNDALSLVQKTFDGIIGQVTANLAPVVTELADQFLQFVEGFRGVDGATGGSALADAISDAFFGGADYLATVLDPWIASLLGWGEYFGQTTSQLGGWFEYFRTAVELMQGAFYTVRAFLNEFVANLADWAKLLPAALRPDTETLDAFTEGLRRSAKEDRQAAFDAFMGRNRERPDQPAGPLQKFLAEAVERGKAEREGQRAARAAQQEQEKAAAAKRRADEAAKKAEEARLQAIKRADKAILKAQEDRAKRAAEIEADRLDALSRASTEALTVSDVRSGGISEVMRLATGREDPAIAESRKQLAELKKIEQRIADLRAEKVKIIGGAGRAA